MVIILKIAVNYASSNTFNAQFVLVYAIIVHFVHRYFFVLHNNVATCCVVNGISSVRLVWL